MEMEGSSKCFVRITKEKNPKEQTIFVSVQCTDKRNKTQKINLKIINSSKSLFFSAEILYHITRF